MAISPQENGAGDQVAEQSGPVLIKGHFLVDENSPILDLSLPSTKAYEVSDARNIDRELFALVCTPGIPTRLNHAPELISMDHKGVMTLVTWDVVFWPLINQKTIIMIYERPQGGSVVGAIKRGDFNVREEDFQSIIVEPVFRAIEHLNANNIVHREIRAENLFFMDKQLTEVVVGDCISCPPGFDQPIIYEPVHRAMASAGGRGTGELSDDLYALGVTMVVLMLGEKIVEYETQEDLFTAKVQEGTFKALCGNRQTYNSVKEPLCGFLVDDLNERWGLDEMSLWQSGKKSNTKKHIPKRQANKPYFFMEKNYFNPRILAHAFTKNIKEGAEAIKNDKLETWLRESLNDNTLADNINAISILAVTHGHEVRNSDEHIVTKATIHMDPLGPIRFKGLSFMPDGYGSTMAVELLRRNSLQTAAEVLRYNLPNIWYAAPSDQIRDNASLKFQINFRKISGTLQNIAPGFGIERCLYELNQSLPCQSSLISEECVVNIKELLPALDNVANQADKNLRPLDRHLTAFIAARFKGPIETELNALSGQKDSSYLLGMLSLLARLQSDIIERPLHALTSWIGSLLGPTIEVYFNLFTRQRIKKEIPLIVQQGDLLKLLDLVNNPITRQQDEEEFDNACTEYKWFEDQIQDIKSGDLSSPEVALEQGQKFSALTSVVILMIFVTILILSELS